MDDVCHDVQIEPKLQSLDGEIFSSNSTASDDDARLDIKANGLWGSGFNRTFFDVKIFNPHAKSCPKTIKDAYKHHESIKQNKYEEQIRETEHSSFNALVFACSGGVGPSSSRVMKQLATKISEKRGEPYADTLSYIRTKISFWKAVFSAWGDVAPSSLVFSVRLRLAPSWRREGCTGCLAA